MKASGAKALALMLALSIYPAQAAVQKPKANNEKVKAYQRAKEQLPPDLYVVYRITERIVTANSIDRPIRVAVRRGVAQADGACEGALGVENQSNKCQAYDLLPDIDKSTNFDLWAAQVVSTMSGSPNAAASSDSGTIWINHAMLKEVSGKPDQLACVIGHELAHVTQNHNEVMKKASTKYNSIAGERIAIAAKKAKSSQQTAQTASLIFAGLASGLAGNNYALYQASNSIAMDNLSAQLYAPEVAKQALKYAPEVGEGINTMQGLTPSYVNQVTPKMNNYLRDAALSLAGVSRGNEYEADLLGVEYVTSAGFNPNECVKLWRETMPHDKNKLISRLLPQGIKDPINEPQAVATTTTIKTEIAVKKPVECVGTARECESQGSLARSKEEDSNKVPQEVLDALASTHPSDPDRANAISQHIDAKTKSKLASKGSSKLNTQLMRNWSYDKLSDSVLVTNNSVPPSQAGVNAGGTTGIDVDKTLGF